MKRLFILILLMTPSYAADPPVTASTAPATPAPPAPAPAQSGIRMFSLKYADAEQLRKLFSAFSYPITTNRDFNVLLVTAPPGFQDQVQEVIKQFDVAPQIPKNLELTIYVLTGADAPGSIPLPKELREMEKQLVAASSYKAFTITDSQVIRIRPGLPGEASGSLALSQIRFRSGWINSDDKGKVISFDGLRVQVKNTTLTTDLDLREGQLAIIGKAGLDGLLLAIARIPE